MDIIGYKYITHKIIPRSWGIECRFTVEKNGLDFNEIVMLETGKEDEKEIAKLIESMMARVDHTDEPALIPEKIYSETEIKSLLVEKGYLSKEQEIVELKTKAELIAEMEVKP